MAPPRVPITLDRERTLQLDFRALEIAQELTGRDFTEPASWGKLGIKGTVSLVFALLKHEDPALTREQVASMLHPGNARAVREAINNLIDAAGGQDPEQNPSVAEASGSAGPSPATTAG